MNRQSKTRKNRKPGLALIKSFLLRVNERSRRVWEEMRNITPWGLR